MEENSLGGRVKRYAQVGRAVGGLAAKLGAERMLGIRLDRGRHASDLTDALGGLKGPLMKVAQILSTIPDALPEEYTIQLAQLQANAPEMGWAFVKRRMASELGPDWQRSFARFEHEAAAAASLGQGSIAPPRWTAATLRASCNIPTWPAWSRPICANSRWCWGFTPPTTTPSTPATSTPS